MYASIAWSRSCSRLYRTVLITSQCQCHVSSAYEAYPDCITSLYYGRPPYVIGHAIIVLPCGFYLSFFMAALRSRCGHYILPCGLYLSIFFYSSPNLSCRRLDVYLPYFDTWCGLSANLECMSGMCCTRLARNTGRKKSPSAHHRTILSGYMFANWGTYRQSEKNLLNSNRSEVSRV